MDKTIYSEYFCPKCGKYSGESFKIISEGKSPPDSEILKCQCGWIGSWKDCRMTEGLKRNPYFYSNIRGLRLQDNLLKHPGKLKEILKKVKKLEKK